MNKKYQPGNGTEGEWFLNRFCFQCVHDNVDHNKEDGCPIVAATMCFNVNDPEYPKEWIYNDDNEPVCTAFERIPPCDYPS